jgi:hypothetical protein
MTWAYQVMLNRLNDGLVYPDGSKIRHVEYSDAPWIDRDVLDLYGRDDVDDFRFDGDFVWIRRKDTWDRRRVKWPFIMILRWTIE